MWSRDKLMEGGYRCLLTWWSRTHLEGAHNKTGALSQILQRQLIDLTRKLFDVPKQVQRIKNKSSIGIWQVYWWLVPCFQMRSVWPMWPPRPLPRVPGCLVMVIDCHLSCGLDSSWLLALSCIYVIYIPAVDWAKWKASFRRRSSCKPF